MLAAFDIRLSPAADASLPHPCAHQVHAALLAAVNRVNPEQARALHSDAQVKPFAISTLWPRIRIRATTLEVPKDTECRVRLVTNALGQSSLGRRLVEKDSDGNTAEGKS
ncbi:MAG: hypothetical protein WHZ52_08045 [Armatimonadota bacterium]